MPTLPSVDRRVLTYAVAAHNKGEPVVLDVVLYAVLPSTAKPTLSTSWLLVPVVGGEVAITVAGMEAGPGEGVALARGTYRVHIRALDNPESITTSADVVTIT